MKKNFVFGAAETTKSVVLGKMGNFGLMVVDTPNFTNNVTTTITVTDADGMVMYTKSTLARNSHNEVKEDPEIPVEPDWTMTLTLSGVPGSGGGTVVVSIPGMDTPGW